MNDAPDKVVASIKSNPSTANPSTETLSFEVIPLIAPDPYQIEHAVPFFTQVDDDDDLQVLCKKHAGDQQFLEGTHKFDEPVSKTTLKV